VFAAAADIESGEVLYPESAPSSFHPTQPARRLFVLDTPNTKPSITPRDDNAGHDPLEAIYALNIGDFVAESFISDDLLTKISHRLADNPQKLKAQLEELIHIYSIDKTLGVLGLDAQAGFLIYDSIASTLTGMFEVDACHLFQVATKDTGEQTLSLTGTSVELDTAQRWEISIQTKALDFLCDVLKDYETRIYPDTHKIASWKPIERIGQTQTRSVIATPLREGHKAIGILILEGYSQTEFSPELAHLATVSGQVFVTSMRLQQLVAEAQKCISEAALDSNILLNLRAQITESIADLGGHQQDFVEALSAAVDARHNFTRGHSKMVGQLAQAIAEQLELNEKTVDLTYIAGLLGSLGKVHIPREVLSKKDSLTPEEWDRLRAHPNVGVSLLVKINFLSEVIPYVHSQNERWDGSGSPEKLKGKSIPLGSRILGLANAYYGMTQERPYRGQPLSHAEALATLQKEAGVKWDPLVVEAFAKISPDTFS
jgi:HD-GYP domain-containing protein (c-di-GMP phosphodiesterase class II)